MESSTKSTGRWKWFVGVPVGLVIAFLLFGAVIGNSTEGKERAGDRDAIDYCWKEQSRKSLNPASSRLAAQTCERMQDSYREKWGRNP